MQSFLPPLQRVPPANKREQSKVDSNCSALAAFAGLHFKQSFLKGYLCSSMTFDLTTNKPALKLPYGDSGAFGPSAVAESRVRFTIIFWLLFLFPKWVIDKLWPWERPIHSLLRRVTQCWLFIFVSHCISVLKISKHNFNTFLTKPVHAAVITNKWWEKHVAVLLESPKSNNLL